MLYFKNIFFPDHVSQPQVEKSLRKYALKRTSSLDFKSTAMYAGTDKLFLGLEQKNALEFTRIKTRFGVILPKLIIKLPKDTSAKSYKIRLSAVPFALFILLAFLIFTAVIGLFKGTAELEAALFVFLLSIVFVSLLAIELRSTQSAVSKSIENSDKE